MPRLPGGCDQELPTAVARQTYLTGLMCCVLGALSQAQACGLVAQVKLQGQHSNVIAMLNAHVTLSTWHPLSTILNGVTYALTPRTSSSSFIDQKLSKDMTPSSASGIKQPISSPTQSSTTCPPTLTCTNQPGLPVGWTKASSCPQYCKSAPYSRTGARASSSCRVAVLSRGAVLLSGSVAVLVWMIKLSSTGA